MTDKALEAALKACPFCGGGAKYYHRDDGSGWSNTDWVCCENDECGCGTCLHETADIAIAAWNRRAPVSALPGEAEVVGLVDRLRTVSDMINMGEKIRWGEETSLMDQAAASLQAMQARAEKAEDRADGWKLQWEQETKAKAEVLSWYTREKARAEKAEREMDIASREIRSLLTYFVRDHFPDNTEWRPLDDLVGMITQMDNACTVARDYLSRAEAAEARVKELEEALKPFVPVYEPWMDKHADNVGLGFYRPATFGDLRRARTTLKGGSNG